MHGTQSLWIPVVWVSFGYPSIPSLVIPVLETVASFHRSQKCLGSLPVREQMAAPLKTQLRPFLHSYTFYAPCTQFRYSILRLHDSRVPTNPEDPCRHQNMFLYPLTLAQRWPHRRPEWTDVHSRFFSMRNETMTDPFKEGKTT